MAMTREELLEAMRALVDAAEAADEPMSDEDAQRYADLERQLAALNRTDEIQKRQKAYESPTARPGYVAPAKADDTEMRAFKAYLRTGQANQDLIQTRAQSEGVGSEGGFLVPTEMRNKIVERMVAFGGFASAAETITTSTGAPQEFPTIDDTANLGTITAEAGQFTGGADLVFGKKNLGAYKYTSSGANNAPLRISVELLQDEQFDVVGKVSKFMGMRIARLQAVHWVTGTGAGEPEGLMGAGITEDRDVDTHDVIDYEDLVDTQILLDAAYEQNAKWLMSKATWGQIRLIVDTAGRPIIQDSTTGISGLPQRSLLGAPVIIDEAVPDFPGAGNEHFLAYGDFSEAYVIRRVANLSLVVNPYSRANFAEVEYVAWERADGIVQNRNSYVVLANTAS